MSASLAVIGGLVTIYGGIPILVVGVIGGILNIIIFLSLRTFRQSSCAYYLIVMSIMNVGQLVFSLLPRIMVAISGSDGTDSSLFYCKFRIYITQIFVGCSLTCFCLATIDQYFATCSRPRWQQWCNTKLAQRLIIAVLIIWTLHGIPYLVFYDHVISPTTNKVTCNDINYIYTQYRACFIILVLFGYLPIVIAAVFGSMALRNLQQMAYRTVPLVRRELEKQLTIMVLVQVIVNTFTLLPFTTVNAIATNTSFTANPDSQAKLNLAVTITVIIFFTFFAVSNE
jgi:hypothetical protein